MITVEGTVATLGYQEARLTDTPPGPAGTPMPTVPVTIVPEGVVLGEMDIESAAVCVCGWICRFAV